VPDIPFRGSEPVGLDPLEPSARRRDERPGPGGIPGRERGIGPAGVDEILVARRVVDVIEDLLEIHMGVRIPRD